MSYPKKVTTYTDNLIKILSEELDPEYNNENFLAILQDRLNDKSVSEFIKSGDVIIPENEFDDCFSMSIIEYTVMNMVDDGIVNYVEDENGEETFFLTEKGKKVGEKLIGDE